jgi:CheY-like chemotaxis protein
VCASTTNHRPRLSWRIDVKIKCSLGILFTASLDIFAPTPATRGKKIAKCRLDEPARTINILVVGDDWGVLRLVIATFQNAGYKILEATCGREGLKRFSEHHADTGLVLNDLSMPTMTGSEMIRHILRIGPCVRVMFMAGTTGEPKLQPGYFKKTFLLVHQSFTIEGLIDSVEKCLATCNVISAPVRNARAA